MTRLEPKFLYQIFADMHIFGANPKGLVDRTKKTKTLISNFENSPDASPFRNMDGFPLRRLTESTGAFIGNFTP